MTTQDPRGSTPEVKSVLTTLQIVETLQRIESATASELATELDFTTSTVYKHLSTLAKERYVIKEDNHYRIGLRFLNLGQNALRNQEIYQIVKPELVDLAEETDEMANLLVEEGGRGVFVHKVSSDRAVNLDTYIGKEVYLHTTALGKAILAHLPRKRVDEIIDQHGLPEVTAKTITDRQTLESELSTVRERGYAVDDEERLYGLQCVSVPILGKDGVPLGAISVSGPKSRMAERISNEEIHPLLSQAKNVIELNVTYK